MTERERMLDARRYLIHLQTIDRMHRDAGQTNQAYALYAHLDKALGDHGISGDTLALAKADPSSPLSREGYRVRPEGMEGAE